MTGANPARGEASLYCAGEALVLRPSFAALVAAEQELGPLFALVERASAGGLRLEEMTALFWHCLAHREDLGRENLTREAVGAAIAGGATSITVIPSMLTPGGVHSEVEIPEALTELRARHPEGRVVVVSHGVAIHHMLRHLLGVASHGIVFQVDNGSIQRIEWKPDGVVRVAALNDTRHL